jgi:hypothetical protein
MPSTLELMSGASASGQSTLELMRSVVPVKSHTRSRRKQGPLWDIARGQAKNLPVYGATAGAILGAGTPATPVGGAMIGAAGGKTLEQSLSGVLGVEGPDNLIDAYVQQANAAAVQGAMEGVPSQLVAPAVKVVARTFAKSQMGQALRPAMATVRNFPRVVEDALRQGASVNTWFGMGGAQRAIAVRNTATSNVVGLLRAATRRGKAIDIDAVAAPVIKAVEKKSGPLRSYIGPLGPVDERANLIAAVQARADELLLKSVLNATKRSSKVMSPMMADELRKAAARSAQSTLNAESAGLVTTALPDMDRLIAKGAAEAVKRLYRVRAGRAAEQTAIGVARAVREAEIRPAPAAVGVGLGPIHAGISLPPSATSRLALLSYALSNSPNIGPLIATLLRAGSLGAPGPQVSPQVAPQGGPPVAQ